MTTLATENRKGIDRAPTMRTYFLTMIVSGSITLAVMALTLLGLRSMESLPPPQFSNSLCIDEKLHTMHRAPPRDPGLLVVGSSVAWRHFNATAAIATDPDLKPFNAGFCGANMAEVEKVTNWLTGRLPTVKHVVLIASPFDFEACTKSSPSQFDVTDADDFVFRGGSPAFYYARYFDPIALAKNATKVRTARSNTAAMDPLVQDLYGDAPSEPTETRGLYYGHATIDPPCFQALRRTALALDRKGIPFDVTITPMHPDWVRQFAPAQYAREFDTRLQASLAGTKARFVSTTYQPNPGAFYDAMHMRWSTTAPFTRWLITTVRPKQSPPPLKVASLKTSGNAR